MRQLGCKPGHRRGGRLEEKGNDYGKGNRVLHTEHLPKKDDLDPHRATRESNRVLLTGKEVGLSGETLSRHRAR